MKNFTKTMLSALIVGFAATSAFAGKNHTPEPSFDRIIDNFYRVLVDPRGTYNQQGNHNRWNQKNRTNRRVYFNGWKYAGSVPRRVSRRHGNNCYRVTKTKRGRHGGWKQVNAISYYNRHGSPYIARGSRHVVDQFAGRRRRKHDPFPSDHPPPSFLGNFCGVAGVARLFCRSLL
jgi:hypothetical protein